MAEEATTNTAAVTEPETTPAPPQEQTQEPAPLNTEAIEKLVQSRVDKITAELGKKNATLQKELDKVKREKLSDDEVRSLEMADREKALLEKEQALTERENRLYAIKAIKEAGLDDGSQQSLDLVDFVLGADEDTINGRVKAFKNLVDKFVAAKVDQTFKATGRNPNSGGKASDAQPETSIAVSLGKQAAERTKQSNDILKHYYGG